MVRPGFKPGWGRQPFPGGFDSHCLPPILTLKAPKNAASSHTTGAAPARGCRKRQSTERRLCPTDKQARSDGFHERLPNEDMFERIFSNLAKPVTPSRTAGSSKTKPKNTPMKVPIPDSSSAITRPKSGKSHRPGRILCGRGFVLDSGLASVVSNRAGHLVGCQITRLLASGSSPCRLECQTDSANPE